MVVLFVVEGAPKENGAGWLNAGLAGAEDCPNGFVPGAEGVGCAGAPKENGEGLVVVVVVAADCPNPPNPDEAGGAGSLVLEVPFCGAPNENPEDEGRELDCGCPNVKPDEEGRLASCCCC